MSKRQRFIIQSVILALGLLGTQFVEIRYRYWAIGILSILTYFFSAFSIGEDLKKTAWLTSLPLPTLYISGVALFYFLLPEGFLTRVLILIFFGIGMYAILLIENIFNIAALRTIQLLRAAHAVGFLMTLVTAFMLYDTIFSFKWNAITNAFLVFPVSFMLILSSLWSVSLSETIEKKIIQYVLALALAVSQLAFFISFWPLKITDISLFLVTACYVLLGVVQNYLTGKLFKNTLGQYLRVGIIVLIITFFLGQWG
jgi:hypothetical protein